MRSAKPHFPATPSPQPPIPVPYFCVKKKNECPKNQQGELVLQAAPAQQPAKRTESWGPRASAGEPRPEASTGRRGGGIACCPPGGRRGPERDGWGIRTPPRRQPVPGTGGARRRVAAALRPSFLSRPSACPLLGCSQGLGAGRGFGGWGGVEVMSLDLCRAPFGAADGAKHGGGVSRAQVYAQTQTKSASHAIRGGDWDVRVPGAARPRGAEEPGWYERSTERRGRAL